MTVKSSRRRSRGVILTTQGKQKLELAIQVEQDSLGKRISLEEMGDRAALDPGTVSKVLEQERSDRRSLERLFTAFKLDLTPIDFTTPSPAVEHSISNTVIDWGDAPELPAFYGRDDELKSLTQWVVRDRYRLVMISGSGGIGKTTLSIKLTDLVQDQFEFVIWRSLINAPPLVELVADLIQVLSNQEATDFSLNTFQKYLRQHRCLIVLDNIESILQNGAELEDYPTAQPGYYRQGYSDYGMLLGWVAIGRHNSCLVLAGRQRPDEFVTLENSRFRIFSLGGLTELASRAFIQAQGALEGSESDWTTLIKCYVGNPLMLKIATSNIEQFFGHNISKFLESNNFVLRRIGDLLNIQFERLSGLEQQVMYWLALEREPMSAEELLPNFEPPVSLVALLAAIQELWQRSLIERSEDAFFSLQPVVMEYVTANLLRHICSEVITQNPKLLLTQATNHSNLTELITSANQLLVAEMFCCIRAAKLAGQTSAEVPAIPITLKITEDMKRYGIIADVQASEMHPETRLLLRFHPSGHDGQSQSGKIQQSQVQLAPIESNRPPAVENGLNAEELPPELAQIVQDLQHNDPAIRIHALDALGELYREPTQSGE